MSNMIEYSSNELKNKIFKLKKVDKKILSKDGEEYILFRDTKHINLDILTYLGAINAEHYYGTIKVDGANTICKDKDTGHESIVFARWKFDIPKEYWDIEIRLKKKIDAKLASYLNKKNSCLECSSKYKKGQYVSMFDTQKEVILEAKRVLETNFEPHIKIKITGYTDGIEDFIKKLFGDRLINEFE